METINHECYVSLEVAKLLKQAGFDWKCEYAYMPSTEMGNVPFKHLHNRTNYNELQYEVYSAPILEVTQRWLREMKNIWVEVLLVNATDPHYRVDLVNASRYNNSYGILHDADYKEYETPEQAQEAGIKKALEIIRDMNTH